MDYYPEQAQGGGLAGYFTSTLESSFISRRGRPPVIRAAEKVRSYSTLLQGKHSEHSVQLISFLYWITLHCFGSGSAWIRIKICLLDPDPGGKIA